MRVWGFIPPCSSCQFSSYSNSQQNRSICICCYRSEVMLYKNSVLVLTWTKVNVRELKIRGKWAHAPELLRCEYPFLVYSTFLWHAKFCHSFLDVISFSVCSASCSSVPLDAAPGPGRVTDAPPTSLPHSQNTQNDYKMSVFFALEILSSLLLSVIWFTFTY
jgi:hypothetical protein